MLGFESIEGGGGENGKAEGREGGESSEGLVRDVIS